MASNDGTEHADTPPVRSSAGLATRTFKNSSMVLAARVVSRLIALVSVLVLGNALGATGFGEFQNAVTYGAIIGVVMDLGLTTLYTREGARHPESISRYLNSLLSTKILLAGICIPILWIALTTASISFLFLSSVALVIATSYANLLRNTFYALQKLTYEALVIVPEACILLLLVVIGASHHLGAEYYMFAYAGDALFIVCYVAVVAKIRHLVDFSWKFDLPLLREWFVTGLPLASVYVVTNIYFKMDGPILEHFRSYSEVGWYTFAYKPFEALLFLPMSLRAVVFPALSIYAKEKSPRALLTIDKFFKLAVIMGIPCSVGIGVLAPQIASLIHLYPQSAPALQILAVAIVFMFADNTFIMTFNAHDLQKVFAWIAFAGLVFNLVLDFALIPPFGYIGACWADVSTEIFLMAAGWWCLRSRLHTIPLWKLSWKALLAGAVMGALDVLLRPGAGHTLPVLGLIALSAVVYCACLLALRQFDRDELRLALSMVRRT